MADNICSINGCESPVVGRGWCNKHWLRWRRYGDPTMGLSYGPENRLIRFWAKVDKAGPDDCWEWMAHRKFDGYGRFRVAGEYPMAHRFSYELHVGPIPDGMCVCHSCDNPACVNPAHLWLGTNDENMTDMARKGRARPPTGENSHWAKLTEDDVRAIRADQTSTQRELAAKYGVNRSLISMIQSRKRWAWLD